METAKIVALSIVSAIVYGILHDQVTARVCVEYFTIGHPPVFNTDSPTLLAFGWGVIATWWVGLLLGVPVAFVSRVGSWPKFDAARLIRPVCCLIVVMGSAALFAGLSGYFVADAGLVWLTEPLRPRVPAVKHSLFLADLWAHITSYAVGFLGGITVCGWILFKRRQMAARATVTAASLVKR